VHVDRTTIPSGTDTNGNAAFAASQYWYETYTGSKANTAGYLGTQVSRGKNGQENSNFIFSCWDADPEHKVGWTTEHCSRFGGEGVGSHCLLEYPIKKGVVYNFRVAQDGHNETGAFWTGTVTPQNGDPVVTVGTLFYPHLNDKIGFGNFKVQSDDFLEYFGGGTCDGAATTGVGIFGPYFHNHTMVPLDASPAYATGAGKCNRTEVSSCIPGHGCGAPRVFLNGGEGVSRDTKNGQSLWRTN
jgi:hypothetical protein